jgi:hypothetical protein
MRHPLAGLRSTASLGMLVLSLSGCAGTEQTSPVNAVAGSGTIIGSVSLYNRKNGKILDGSNATAELVGTVHRTTTDETGRWRLTGVLPGTYDIICSKPGFSEGRVYGVSFAGNGRLVVPSPLVLAELPRARINIENVFFSSDSILSATAHYLGPDTASSYYVVLFLHTSSDVSREPGHWTRVVNLGYAGPIIPADTIVNLRTDGRTLYHFFDGPLLPQGSTVFACAHFMSTFSSVTDPDYNQPTYPCSSAPSNVVSFKLP